MKWPKSKWIQAVIAFLGGIIIAVLMAWVSMILSAIYFGHKYPHDGQNGLGALAVLVMSFPFWAAFAGPLLYFLQLRLTEKIETEDAGDISN